MFRDRALVPIRAALARAPRGRRLATLLRSAAAAAYAGARRRPDAVLAVALLLGVFVMVLHWKGSPVDVDAVQRAAAQEHAVSGP